MGALSNTVQTALKSKLFKSTGIYTVVNAINAFIPFMFLPLLTRILSPEDYGNVSMFTMLVSFFLPFIGLNFHAAISRRFVDKEKYDLQTYVSTVVKALFINVLFAGGVLYLIDDLLAEWIKYPVEWLWGVFLVALAQFVLLILYTIWQMEFRPKIFGVFRICQTVVDVSLSLLFVLQLDMGWEGRVWGILSASSLFMVITLIILASRRMINFDWNQSYLKDALKLGTPLIFHNIGMLILTLSDRFMIRKFVGEEEMGVFSAATMLGLILMFLINSFNQSWVPWLFDQLKKDQPGSKQKIVKITYGYFVGVLLAVAGLVAFSYLLQDFLLGRNDYDDALKYLVWIALGYAFNGMYKMVTNYIFYVEKNKYLMIVTLLTAALNIILNIFLIEEFGAIGAAYASAISFFCSFIFTWWLSHKLFPMPWARR